MALKSGNLFTDRRLADSKSAGGGGKAAALDDSDKHLHSREPVHFRPRMPSSAGISDIRSRHDVNARIAIDHLMQLSGRTILVAIVFLIDER